MYILLLTYSIPQKPDRLRFHTRDYFAGHNNNNSSVLAVYMNNNSNKQIIPAAICTYIIL